MIRRWLIRRFGAVDVARVFISIEWDIGEYAVIGGRDAGDIASHARIVPASSIAPSTQAVCVPLLADMVEIGRVRDAGVFRGWALDPRSQRRWPAELRRSARAGLTFRLMPCGGLLSQHYRLRRIVDATHASDPCPDT